MACDFHDCMDTSYFNRSFYANEIWQEVQNKIQIQAMSACHLAFCSDPSSSPLCPPLSSPFPVVGVRDGSDQWIMRFLLATTGLFQFFHKVGTDFWWILGCLRASCHAGAELLVLRLRGTSKLMSHVSRSCSLSLGPCCCRVVVHCASSSALDHSWAKMATVIVFKIKKSHFMILCLELMCDMKYCKKIWKNSTSIAWF